MSKLSVILLNSRKDRVVLKQFYGAIREKSSLRVRTDWTRLEVTSSPKFCNRLSEEAFGTRILKPFSLASQSRGFSFSATSSCLEKGDKRGRKPLSNEIDADCEDSNRKPEDPEECPEDCKETAKAKSSSSKKKKRKRKRRKKKKKRKHRKRSKEHEEDDCEDGGKRRKEEEKRNEKCDNSERGKSSAAKSWPVCKPRARRYRDPYKKEGGAGFFAGLLQCGPKQCEIMMRFLVSALLFYLATLALFFYWSGWQPWKKAEKPPEPEKKAKKVEAIEEEEEEEEVVVAEKPKKQRKEPEEQVTKHIEVLDVECVCDDHGDDNDENES